MRIGTRTLCEYDLGIDEHGRAGEDLCSARATCRVSIDGTEYRACDEHAECIHRDGDDDCRVLPL